MMHDESIKVVAFEEGWIKAYTKDDDEVLINDLDIPESADILIPWWAMHNPSLYVEEFQKGFKAYIDENFYMANQAV